MARAALLKRLFASYKRADNAGFLAASKEIIDEERRKNHTVLANELTHMLGNGSVPVRSEPRMGLEALPKDSDRGMFLFEVKHPDRFLKDLILHEDQLKLLNTVMNEFTHWEFLEAHSLHPSHKLLFCGPPGCGKTATAEALANELRLPLLYVRFDSVVSSLLGETAANLRKVFEFSSQGNWVLLFDEFDAIGRSRDDVYEHGELKRVVNCFLQMLDQFSARTLVIAATNFEQALDPALWRRFDEVIRFEKPDDSHIRLLIEKKLGGKPCSPGLIDTVAHQFKGMSQADIERICFDILRHVTLEGRTALVKEDFARAVEKQEMRRKALLKSRPDGRPRVGEE